MAERLCEQCGEPLPDRWPSGRRICGKQRERQRFCGAQCANSWRAWQQTLLAREFGDWGAGDTAQQRKQYRWRLKQQGSHWAERWEQHRVAEDLAELARSAVGVTQFVGRRPVVRQWVMGYCRGCGGSWVDYQARQPSGYCRECQRARWRETHLDRARRYGVKHEPVVPQKVFERDGWRCQICRGMTRGEYPAQRSPSLDHIVPMVLGGDHAYENTQCAHLLCNLKKHAKGAGDQMLLFGGVAGG